MQKSIAIMVLALVSISSLTGMLRSAGIKTSGYRSGNSLQPRIFSRTPVNWYSSSKINSFFSYLSVDSQKALSIVQSVSADHEIDSFSDVLSQERASLARQLQWITEQKSDEGMGREIEKIVYQENSLKNRLNTVQQALAIMHLKQKRMESIQEAWKRMRETAKEIREREQSVQFKRRIQNKVY